MFLFHGNATRAELVATVMATLRDICTEYMSGSPSVWRVHGGRNPRLERL
jgi:hypothetical protein